MVEPHTIQKLTETMRRYLPPASVPKLLRQLFGYITDRPAFPGGYFDYVIDGVRGLSNLDGHVLPLVHDVGGTLGDHGPPRQCWVLLGNISHNNVPIGTSDFPAFALPDILLVGTDLPAFRPLPMDRSVCLAPHLRRPPFDGCLIDLRDIAVCIDTASFLGSVAHRE